MFSYNSPQGWCPKCRGFGELFYLPDVERGANADAIEESWFGWQEGKRELCPECNGVRLNGLAPRRAPNHHAARLSPNIETFAAMSVSAADEFFRKLRFKGRAAWLARDILPEIGERLKFLSEVGLGYLQMGRGVPTLSGGETQRIRLAAQLGSNLSGASCMCSMNRPSACTRATTNNCLPHCNRSNNAAIPSWSSSMTKKRCVAPTTSSTSDLVLA